MKGHLKGHSLLGSLPVLSPILVLDALVLYALVLMLVFPKLPLPMRSLPQLPLPILAFLPSLLLSRNALALGSRSMPLFSQLTLLMLALPSLPLPVLSPYGLVLMVSPTPSPPTLRLYAQSLGSLPMLSLCVLSPCGVCSLPFRSRSLSSLFPSSYALSLSLPSYALFLCSLLMLSISLPPSFSPSF